MTNSFMKVSFITTVLNEEKTIGKLLVSLTQQTRKPDEVIIVDGGSSDKTIKIMQNAKCKMQNYNSKFKIIQKRGNRAMGRNRAIKMATGEIIVMSDAGCGLEKRWVEEITKPFFQKFTSWETDVVAGYYQVSKESSIFQRCVACYALVAPDKVDPENFLPASRSMAIRKNVFEKFGGFPEDFSDNEDYVFANRLKNGGAKIVFNKDAIVYWQPVSNLKDFFRMIFRFARGDAKAGLRKGKVALVFVRYAIGGAIGLISLVGPIWLGILGVLGYLIWAVFKNYNYVRDPKAILFLPVLQIVSDLAVMTGTIL